MYFCSFSINLEKKLESWKSIMNVGSVRRRTAGHI